MYNLRKKYKVHPRSPRRNVSNGSSISNCFFAVGHQETIVMYKKGNVCITCPRDWKLPTFARHGFLHILHNFCKVITGVCLDVITEFYHFCKKKCPIFFEAVVYYTLYTSYGCQSFFTHTQSPMYSICVKYIYILFFLCMYTHYFIFVLAWGASHQGNAKMKSFFEKRKGRR